MREAVIVAASRTAVGKSRKGATRNQRSDEMAVAVIPRGEAATGRVRSRI